MLIVLVERQAPRHLLRRRVDLHGAHKTANRRQHLASYVADLSVGSEGDALHTPVAVLDDRLMGS